MQLADFLAWFESSRSDASLDLFLRAGIAHFWFVTLHPFDDGNGRLTRAITDLALAQGEQQAIRFYAMSASILDDRAGYYRILEASQKGTLDITAWLQWFLATLLNSLEQALARIDRVLSRRASGRHTAAKPYRRSKSKYLTACSMAANGVLRTVSARRNTRP